MGPHLAIGGDLVDRLDPARGVVLVAQAAAVGGAILPHAIGPPHALEPPPIGRHQGRRPPGRVALEPLLATPREAPLHHAAGGVAADVPAVAQDHGAHQAPGGVAGEGGGVPVGVHMGRDGAALVGEAPGAARGVRRGQPAGLGVRPRRHPAEGVDDAGDPAVLVVAVPRHAAEAIGDARHAAVVGEGAPVGVVVAVGVGAAVQLVVVEVEAVAVAVGLADEPAARVVAVPARVAVAVDVGDEPAVAVVAVGGQVDVAVAALGAHEAQRGDAALGVGLDDDLPAGGVGEAGEAALFPVESGLSIEPAHRVEAGLLARRGLVRRRRGAVATTEPEHPHAVGEVADLVGAAVDARQRQALGGVEVALAVHQRQVEADEAALAVAQGQGAHARRVFVGQQHLVEVMPPARAELAGVARQLRRAAVVEAAEPQRARREELEVRGLGEDGARHHIDGVALRDAVVAAHEVVDPLRRVLQPRVVAPRDAPRDRVAPPPQPRLEPRRRRPLHHPPRQRAQEVPDAHPRENIGESHRHRVRHHRDVRARVAPQRDHQPQRRVADGDRRRGDGHARVGDGQRQHAGWPGTPGTPAPTRTSGRCA
ncbi:MAG: hypothetical protein R3F60_04675 [bacterium]